MVMPRVVVVGTSAGGMGALKQLVAQLPVEFPAAVFIVQHKAAEESGDVLVKTMQEVGD